MLTGKKSHHSIHPLAIAVLATCGLAVTAPNVIDPVFAADWDGTNPDVLQIVTPNLGDVHSVVKDVGTTGDRYDLDTGNHNWLWTVQGTEVENPQLEIIVKDVVTDTQNENKFSDTYGKTKALWITASLQTILTDTKYENYGQYMTLANATSAGPNYSSTTNKSSVILNFKKGSAILAKVYGARNDLGGGTSLDGYDVDAGNANDNSVVVNMAESSKFYAKLVFGGRSSQLDCVQNVVHAGFETNRNSVQINGTIVEGGARTLETNNASLGLVITKGIFGAEGYQANNNRVNLNNVAVVAGMADARKLGLVGGRGLYYYRINSTDTGEYKEVVYGSDEFYKDDGDRSGQRVSAIANNNIVTIKNSYLGYYVDAKNNDMSWHDYPDEEGSGVGFSVYGGWSTGVAADNIVAAEGSVINGNVIGGLEFQDQLKIQEEDGVYQFRDLHANLVSLKDTTIKAGAIYGTTTAEGELQPDSATSYYQTNSLNEKTTQAVNRRRGAAYIAGDVEADSAYVRYITFGQYVDTKALDGTFDVFRNYYPGSNTEGVDGVGIPLDEDPLEKATRRFAEDAKESIHLGQQVAGSYLINRKGYHSSLKATDSSQSNVTDKLHNFWVGAYANLSDGISGDGKSFNTKVSLFNKDDGSVNHGYVGGELSLLTHDDGMWYSYVTDTSVGGEVSNHRPALMHQFRYHYQGLVLYLGMNDGSGDVPAVQISFDEIANFRESQGQNTNAFGNTFVGIIKDGIVYQKVSVEDGDSSVKASEMTFDVPFTIYQSKPKDKASEETVPVAVAKATYGFYKYLHFDGHDGVLDDGTIGKVSDLGTEAGIGLKYWLKSLDITKGESLVLNGWNKEVDPNGLVIENFESGDTSKPKQELFTLSAELTGEGGVTIAKDSTVIIGSPNTIYNIDTEKTDTKPKVPGEGKALYEVVYKTPQPNSYTGATIVSEGAMLVLGIDGALGKNDTKYTSQLHIGSPEAGTKPANVYLQGHVQTVGALQVQAGSVLDFNQAAAISFGETDPDEYQANMGSTGGELTVKNQAGSVVSNDNIAGSLKGSASSKLTFIDRASYIRSNNPDFSGTVELKSSSIYLTSPEALIGAAVHVDKDSSLYFDITKNVGARASALGAAEKVVDENIYTASIKTIANNGSVYLSHQVRGDAAIPLNVSLNKVHIGTYTGGSDSKLFYQGFVQGLMNSDVDVVYADTASGKSTVYFTNEQGGFGALNNSRGEYVGKDGILIFEVKDPVAKVTLSFPAEKGEVLRVVARDNEKFVWGYHLVEQGEDGNDWYLVNSHEDLKPKDDLRPEGGAYMANSQSWAKMHMRLHDRFGQAYYLDPFDGKEKPAAAWVRQVGSHSHFKSGGGASKTHARTAVTQIGSDLIRNEINEDWKYIGGVFAGGLYHRADTRTFDVAKSRSDGYATGIYGTLYTGNSPDDGFYVDTWLLYGRYDNKLWGGMTSTFDYKSHGWVWSVESGYTIPIGESGTKDFNKVIWTFQPEVQLVWDGVKAKDGYDSTDTKYKQLGKDNVSIRVGARVHGNYMNKGLGFIEGNWIHNTKKTGVQMGSSKTYMDGGRDLGEFRMGLEGHITRNTLGWASVGVQAGKAGYHNETAQIGIKYMF